MIAAGGKLRHDVFHSALAVVRDSVQYDAVGHNFHATPFKPQYPHRGRHAAVPAPGYSGTVTIIALFGADFQIYFSQSAGPRQTKKAPKCPRTARGQPAVAGCTFFSSPVEAAPTSGLTAGRFPQFFIQAQAYIRALMLQNTIIYISAALPRAGLQGFDADCKRCPVSLSKGVRKIGNTHSLFIYNNGYGFPCSSNSVLL